MDLKHPIVTILPYCIVLRHGARISPELGILDARVQYLEEAGLAAVYSQIEKFKISADNFQKSALHFHQIVHAIFSHTAAVPFRFPTWLSEAELRQHLRDESNRYKIFLTQHANHVQMEARIRSATPEPASSSITGTEHLRARAAQMRNLRGVAEQAKQVVSAEVVDWRERDTPEGVRLYALVDRDHVISFREKLARYDNVRISGPWPATEFLQS